MTEQPTRPGRRSRLTRVKGGAEVNPEERIFAVAAGTPPPGAEDAANESGQAAGLKLTPDPQPPMRTLQEAQAAARAAGYVPSNDWVHGAQSGKISPRTVILWAAVIGLAALAMFFLGARA